LENGKYSNLNYNSSFVGFFPVENPQVVCLILLNSPKVGGYGGLVAAPIFKEVTKRMLISLQETYRNNTPKPKAESKDLQFIKTLNDEMDKSVRLKKSAGVTNPSRKIMSSSIMPDLRNYSLRGAFAILTGLGVEYSVSGSGKISSQSIAPGTQIKKGSVCRITCTENKNNVVSN
jgi:cell division protein FtsI (penicillin-binding protein 3)